MIHFAALALAAAMQAAPVEQAKVQGMRWEGSAEVYPPGSVLKIAVRSRIDGDKVVSESWPVELGEAKGLRRMTLDARGGTVERGGKSDPMPTEMWTEERAQFGFYTQLQAASLRAAQVAGLGVDTFSVDGPARTWFRIGRDGTLVGATNQVPSEGGKLAHQTFRFDGFWTANGMIFPKHMEMTRDGERYFTLDVTSFHAD